MWNLFFIDFAISLHAVDVFHSLTSILTPYYLRWDVITYYSPHLLFYALIPYDMDVIFP